MLEKISEQKNGPFDILIVTDALGLIPKCKYRIDCLASMAEFCCHQSKFELGWVCVAENTANFIYLKISHTTFFSCLQKVMPHTAKSFFLGESLGTTPVPRYSSCKSQF